MSNNNDNINLEDLSQWIEVAGLSDYYTSYGSSASLTDIRLEDLYRYLQNPYANIKEIQRASKYLTNKHGIVKDVLRTIKSLPTLNYHLHWSSYDDIKKINKYEQKVRNFLDTIDVKQVVRDGLYEVGELGTLILCNRNNKYIQFLDIDDVRIMKQKNGKWLVEFDLKTIDNNKGINDKLAVIESLPEEVTLAKYKMYKDKGEDFRYVELNNCDLVNVDSRRNFPYGLPFTLGAWSSLLQKEMIDKVERSVSERLLKSILILSASHLDKDGTKPVPKELLQAYFKEVSNLFQKKDNFKNKAQNNASGVGVIAFPHFLSLDTLKVDTDLFKKELYEKIDNDIYANLGVSSSLIYGGGNTNYSSAQMNSEKLYKYIFTILEKFERIINDYIKKLVPNNLTCKLVFDRSTIANKDKMINHYKEFFMQTSIIAPWAESLLGVDYQYALAQAEYENKVLKKEDIIHPAANAYTSSGNDDKGGRPSSSDGNAGENTNKSQTQGSNNVPKPSTS